MFPTRRRSATILLAIACGLLAGCGSDEEVRPPLQPVQGVLTINNRPAEGAMLVLHPANGEGFDSRMTRPRAVVGADGRFHVTTYQDGDGAPVGDYRVAILWFANPDSNSPWDKLQGRYSDPANTGIQISIKEGQTELEPISLTGVRVVERPPPTNSPDFDQVD